MNIGLHGEMGIILGSLGNSRVIFAYNSGFLGCWAAFRLVTWGTLAAGLLLDL